MAVLLTPKHKSISTPGKHDPLQKTGISYFMRAARQLQLLRMVAPVIAWSLAYIPFRLRFRRIKGGYKARPLFMRAVQVKEEHQAKNHAKKKNISN